VLFGSRKVVTTKSLVLILVNPYLSIQQAADHLGLSRQGVEYHLKRGRIGIPSIYGRFTLINSFELEKFARRRNAGTFAPIGRPKGARDLRPRKGKGANAKALRAGDKSQEAEKLNP